MRDCRNRRAGFVLLLAWGTLWPLTDLHAQATATPSNMLITGHISPSASVTPAIGDSVLAINPANNATESDPKSSVVLDTNGLYSVTLSQTSALNGTALTLRLQQGTNTYALLDSSTGSPIRFPFSGSLFPVQISLSPVVGNLVVPPPPAGSTPSSTPATPATTGTGTSTPKTTTTTTTSTTNNPSTNSSSTTAANASGNACSMDINGDGACDYLDIQIIKDYLAGKLQGGDVASMDVNKDGIVNTLDVILAIKTILVQIKPKQMKAANFGIDPTASATSDTATTGSTTGSSTSGSTTGSSTSGSTTGTTTGTTSTTVSTTSTPTGP
jgi:hypothetical protein